MFKNIKNKFVIVVILLIVSIISIQFISSNKVDRNSYVTLVEGDGFITSLEEQVSLKVNKRYLLIVGDTVETSGENSLAIIEWGDGSITRLGGDSKLEIKQNFVSDNLADIKILFSLEKGKTWSNVVNFIGEDSYFKQEYVDMEAGVRGTIFEVNLENDYVYVDKHEVTVTKSNGEEIVIPEKKPFNISKFSFIALEKFLRENIDKTWQDINKRFDKVFLENLKRALNGVKELNTRTQEKLLAQLDSSFNSLSEVKKTEIYNQIISSYQKLNFVQPDDSDLYSQKLFYKSLLLNFSSPDDKESLVRSSLFDFKEIIKTGNNYNIKETLNIFNTNKDFMNLEDFKKYFNFDLLPESLKKEFKDNYEFLYDMFSTSFTDIKQKLDDIGNSTKETFNDIKEDLLNK